MAKWAEIIGERLIGQRSDLEELLRKYGRKRRPLEEAPRKESRLSRFESLFPELMIDKSPSPGLPPRRRRRFNPFEVDEETLAQDNIPGREGQGYPWRPFQPSPEATGREIEPPVSLRDRLLRGRQAVTDSQDFLRRLPSYEETFGIPPTQPPPDFITRARQETAARQRVEETGQIQTYRRPGQPAPEDIYQGRPLGERLRTLEGNMPWSLFGKFAYATDKATKEATRRPQFDPRFATTEQAAEMRQWLAQPAGQRVAELAPKYLSQVLDADSQLWQEYGELGLVQQTLYELPIWALTMGTSATSLRASLAPIIKAGGKKGLAAELLSGSLKPVAGVEEVTGIVVKGGLKYGIALPVKSVLTPALKIERQTLRAFENGLDNMIDQWIGQSYARSKWVATQSRLTEQDWQYRLLRLIMGNRSAIEKSATDNFLRYQAEARAGRMSAEAANMEAVKATINDIEIKLLPRGTQTGAMEFGGKAVPPSGDAIAKELGVTFNGIQQGTKDVPDMMLFTDPQTGSTFSARSPVEARTKLTEMRQKFAQAEVAPAPEVKEPWQMTLNEYNIQYAGKPTNQLRPGVVAGLRSNHINNVRQALSEGKPVPAEVLADYPDLAKQALAIPKAEPVTPAPEVTIPKPTRALTETEKPAVVEYYRKEAQKWRNLADQETLLEPSKVGERRYATAVQKAEAFERQARELEQAVALPKAEPVVRQVPGEPEAIAESNPLMMTSAEFNARFPTVNELPAKKQKALLDMLNESNLEETGEDIPLSLADFQKDFGDMRFDLETGALWNDEHQTMIKEAAKEGWEIAPKVREEYKELIEGIEKKKASARASAERKRAARKGEILPSTGVAKEAKPSKPKAPTKQQLKAQSAESEAARRAAMSPIERREYIRGLLKEPISKLPLGISKIELRSELSQLNKEILPQEKKLRQQIMATVKSKSLPQSQFRAIFKDTGGSRQLSTIGLPELQKVLKAVQRARPKTIGGKKVASPEIEQQIQDTKQKLNVSDRDYEAIKRLFNIRNDKFVDSQSFITQRDATRLIKAMKRKSLIGFADIEQAVKELVLSMGPPSKPPTPIVAASFDVPWSKTLGEKINSFKVRTFRVERILDKIDGENYGPLWSIFYKPLNEATSQKIGGLYGKLGEFRNFVAENNIDLGKLVSGKTEIQPGLILSPSEKIGVYLSSLNSDNLRHLKLGNKFSDQMIETVKNSLNEQEKKVADWLKDYFEKEHSAISEAKLYVTDEPLDKVENYFPIRLQWKTNPQLDYWEQIAMEDNYKFATDWASARIPKGFTKVRTPEASQAVDLDAFSIFLNHLEAVEHYKAFAPIIADLQLIMKDNAFKSGFINKAGRSTYQVIDKWLKQTAEINPLRPANQAEALIRTMRVNATTAVLGINITTAMKQFPSFVSGAAEAGIIPSLNGLFTFLRHPNETRALIKQYSPQIYQRSFEREIAEAKKMRGTGKVLAGKLGAREVFMFLTTTMDKTAVSGLWRGSFDNGISKGLSPEQAAAKAEEVIRKTQPFFDVKDLPEYYRSGEFMKALTVFTNQLNNYWNYYYFDIAGKYAAKRISKLEVLRRILLAFVIPALMIGAISRSRPAKDAKEIGMDLSGMAIATIPLAGSWVTSGIKGFTDTSLVTTELADEIAQISNKVSKGQWEEMWVDILSLGGYALGVPVAQPKRSFQAMSDLVTDKTDDWMELIWGKYTRKEAASDKFNKLKSKWESDLRRYSDIPSNVNEVKADRKKYPFTRVEYRKRFPEVDAKLFITGRVSSLSEEAKPIAVRLMRQNGITIDDIPSLKKTEFETEAHRRLRIYFQQALGQEKKTPVPVETEPVSRGEPVEPTPRRRRKPNPFED